MSGFRSDGTPARWAAFGALGGASVVGMLWALLGRAPAPIYSVDAASARVSSSHTSQDSAVQSPSVGLDGPPAAATNAAPEEDAAHAPLIADTADQGPRSGTQAGARPDAAADPDPLDRERSGPAPEETRPASREPPEPSNAVPAGRININTATRAELELLPRIGPTLAQRIIDFRETDGPIRSLTHLTDVKGIGVRTAERIGPYIRFD